MATIVKRKNSDGSFSYMAKIRISKKGLLIHSESKTFSQDSVAKAWALKREIEIEEGQAFSSSNSQCRSDGSSEGRHQDVLADSTASQYTLPNASTELQHLISHRNMNSQIGEVFRACYRYSQVSQGDMLKEAKKIKFYVEAEIERLEKLI